MRVWRQRTFAEIRSIAGEIACDGAARPVKPDTQVSFDVSADALFSKVALPLRQRGELFLFCCQPCGQKRPLGLPPAEPPLYRPPPVVRYSPQKQGNRLAILVHK